MTAFKFIGAAIILLSCGGVGYKIKRTHYREIHTLKMFISALDYMECELQFRMSPLTELCRATSQECEGLLQRFFSLLAGELENQVSPDVKQCIEAVLPKVSELPQSTAEAIKLMGKSIGKFDLPGQLKGLESVRAECRVRLSRLMGNSEVRVRSYQTLGLCAGAAIVILLV